MQSAECRVQNAECRMIKTGSSPILHSAFLRFTPHVSEERSMSAPFMFATGIENSYPTIQGGRVRIDEMEKCGHYDQWRRDFDCVEEIGIRFLRYGPPLHRT